MERNSQDAGTTHPSFQILMAMPQALMLQALEEQAQVLAQQGTSDSVINAYQRMAPLLAEGQAISAYINHTENFNLRAALPEVLSAVEAVLIASTDCLLSVEEQRILLAMLSRLE